MTRQQREERRRLHRECLARRRDQRQAARRDRPAPAAPEALRRWLRWALSRVKTAGRDVAEELIDDAIDELAQAATQHLDLGDSPFADEAEAALSEAVDEGGRALLHRIARSVLEEDDAIHRQAMIPR